MNPTVTIVISRARARMLLEKGLTLQWAQQLSTPTFLLVHRSEERAYTLVSEKYKIPLIFHDVEDRVSAVRDQALDFAAHQGYERLWLLDDDLSFSYRDWSSSSLPRLSFDKLDDVREHVEALCTEQTPMVGLRIRMFANACKLRTARSKRIQAATMLHMPTFQENAWLYEWDGDVMEDFNLQCRVVDEGYNTLVTNNYIFDDALGAWRGGGGCNVYRDNTMRTKAARLLQQRYPDYVTLVQKQDPAGEDYLDVRLRLPR